MTGTRGLVSHRWMLFFRIDYSDDGDLDLGNKRHSDMDVAGTPKIITSVFSLRIDSKWIGF